MDADNLQEYKKSLNVKRVSCFLCSEWEGKFIYAHLRFDHNITSIRAPFNLPLKWTLDVTERKETKTSGRAYYLLIGCQQRAAPLIWFLLTAEQENFTSDFQFQLRCLNGDVHNQYYLSSIRYDGPGYQGFWFWMTPSYSDLSQVVFLPSSVQEAIPLENEKKIMDIKLCIRPLAN